jgi:hypothetical protein
MNIKKEERRRKKRKERKKREEKRKEVCGTPPQEQFPNFFISPKRVTHGFICGATSV